MSLKMREWNAFEADKEKGTPWQNYNFDKKSLALVACNGQGNGCVIYTVGAHLNLEMGEYGLYQLDELSLDDAPLGLSVWEGQAFYIGNRDGEVDSEIRGSFRNLLPEEWDAVRQGKCPWNDEDWKLKTVGQEEQAT